VGLSVRKAVIPAAGLGTRFLPATKAVPKEMLPVVDKPIIQYIVEDATSSGIETVIIVTGFHKRAIEDHFDYAFELEERLKAADKLDLRAEVRAPADAASFLYVRQKEPLGNGHAVLVAREAVGEEPFGMLWGDDFVDADPPVLRQLIDVYERFNAPVVAVMEVSQENVTKYGVIAGERIEDRLWRVRDIVEKPSRESAPSNLAAVVGYVLTPDLFPLLERTPRGQGGEIWLVDAIRELARLRPFYAYQFSGRRYDVGSKLEFLYANVDYALKRADLGPALKRYLQERIGPPDR
jgi:UTP--glucose-1-phosphate uridylyltransferase